METISVAAMSTANRGRAPVQPDADETTSEFETVVVPAADQQQKARTKKQSLGSQLAETRKTVRPTAGSSLVAIPRRPRFMLSPESRKKVLWDVISVILLVYTIIIAPLRLGFELEDYCPQAIWIWETVIDVAFVIDFFLNFITGRRCLRSLNALCYHPDTSRLMLTSVFALCN